ncbi:hypothetical protein KU392_07770 [Advenella alkanexedens]|jgi:hypothetical protein|uniref:Uncharacterized protein n=1 Tax=Advenella alkanexedens TaxID=1481665 RepID=A0ABS6NPH6_9BURK|nr:MULTISPECIES: hypothetical protein [Advenella]MBV4397142.1 hypothetical protein [Advenella alkanexedens]NLN68231.1 hypothetical protein [Alcaligenaceae bacterium]WKU18216.1 hypothetical protein Q3V95_07745 [Advenella alkanexedens]
MQAGKLSSSGSINRHMANDISWSPYDQTYAMLNNLKHHCHPRKNHLSLGRMFMDVCSALVWAVAIPLVLFIGTMAGY